MDDLSMIRVEAGVRLIARCTLCADWAGRMEIDVVVGHALLHHSLARLGITDGEPITERVAFTQRDVDPLGRGNTAQRVGVGVLWACPTHGVGVACRPSGRGCVVDAPPIEGHDYEASWREALGKGSDLRKCDESTLRLDGS